MEETEIELKVLQTRRVNLERVQREPEALRAPVSGVIATSDAVASQMADPNTVVFRIVDPDRLWVEALSFSPDTGRGGAEGRLSDGRAVQPAQITDTLERLSNGRVVSNLVDGTRRFELAIRMPDAKRTAEGLAALLIETPSGWVPLSDVAEVKETDGPNQILREGGRRRIVVLANTSGGRDMAAIVADMRQVNAAAALPPGVSISLEGTFAAQEDAMRTIGGLSAVSLLLVFAILYSRYRSGLFACVIMGSVPLALIGAVVALRPAGPGSCPPRWRRAGYRRHRPGGLSPHPWHPLDACPHLERAAIARRSPRHSRGRCGRCSGRGDDAARFLLP